MRESVPVGTPATRAAKNATDTIPIVSTRVADPVPLGLVDSLVRPSGNLTGVSLIAIDLATKWPELLTEVMCRAYAAIPSPTRDSPGI
jgi:putative ABC transport system substrate-binding protein